MKKKSRVFCALNVDLPLPEVSLHTPEVDLRTRIGITSDFSRQNTMCSLRFKMKYANMETAFVFRQIDTLPTSLGIDTLI